MERVSARVSFADLQRMPDDGNRYELYDGELRVVPSPLPIHQIIVQRLFLALHEFTRDHGGAIFMAPFDIVLSEYNVVQPDLIYFGPASAGRINVDEHVRFPPDLAVEVISPSTAHIDRGRKRDLLARYGVPELWMVDPRATCVEISLLRNGRFADPIIIGGGTLESPTVPGLTIDIDAMFAPWAPPATDESGPHT